MKQENDEIKKDVASGDGFGTTGTTSEGKKYVYVKLQEQKPQVDEPVRGCHGLEDAPQEEKRKDKQRKFKHKEMAPVGSAPVLVPHTTVDLMQKHKIESIEQVQQILNLMRDGVGVYYNAETGEWGNLLNANPARVLFGIVNEFSRQSESIQDYFKYAQGVAHANGKKGAKAQPIVPITKTRQNGFPVLGFPKEKLTPDERELLIELKVQPNEPVCFIYPQELAKNYFGIDLQGAERARFIGYIATISTQRFAWKRNNAIFTSQIFTIVTKTTADGKTLVLVKMISPEFYENIATEYLKLNQQHHKIQQDTKGLFEMRLYFYILDEWKKRHKYVPKKQNVISIAPNVEQLIEQCATQEELAQRKPKQLRKRFYKYLQTLVEQGVLLSYTHEEFNTDGVVSIEIAKNPFVIRQQHGGE